MKNNPKVETVKLDTLILDPANVRKHNRKNIEAIKSSLKRFDYQKITVVVDKDNIVRAGNGTIIAARELGIDELPVVKTNLNGVEATAYAIADNRTAELAEWDEPYLKLQLGSLKNDGFNLEDIGFDLEDQIELELNENTEKDDILEDNYTKKVTIPIYEPKGEKPNIKELFDTKKFLILKEEIEKQEISSDEKEFLILAATRHIIFNYRNIAEYYAQSSSEIQTLFEKSALVIIDFEKAIENQFIKLTQEISDEYNK